MKLFFTLIFLLTVSLSKGQNIDEDIYEWVERLKKIAGIEKENKLKLIYWVIRKLINKSY